MGNCLYPKKKSRFENLEESYSLINNDSQLYDLVETNIDNIKNLNKRINDMENNMINMAKDIIFISNNLKSNINNNNNNLDLINLTDSENISDSLITLS